jgi:hypothetical protein
MRVLMFLGAVVMWETIDRMVFAPHQDPHTPTHTSCSCVHVGLMGGGGCYSELCEVLQLQQHACVDVSRSCCELDNYRQDCVWATTAPIHTNTRQLCVFVCFGGGGRGGSTYKSCVWCGSCSSARV